MIAVIGCGYWGKNLIRNFAELGILKAVCDQDTQKAESFATQYDVKAQSVEEILKDPEITGVAIVTSPRLNTELSIQALNAGKHVFVEKPHAYRTEDAMRLSETQKKSNRILMVGHLLLYHSAYLKVKELLHQGVIGDLKEIRSFRHGLGRIRDEFNVLWELAPHDVSMVLDLNPYPVDDVQAFGSKGLTGQEDTVRALYQFSNGVTAQISSSWADPMRQQQLVLQGTKGFLIFDDTKPWAEKVHLVQFDAPMDADSINLASYQIIPIHVEEQEALKQECIHFLECMEGKTTPRSDLNQASPVFELLTRTQEKL
jgi:UDP-2-acetamido-3-amino-2,3-dideoxy-glucuronate N-acetyltransferase